MRRRFDPGLAVLVPVILGGVAALSVLCAGWLPVLFPRLVPAGSPVVAALLSGIAVAGVSAVFVLVALRPIRRLLATAPPVLPRPPEASERALGEFDRLGIVADQMAETLGKLDARALFPDMVGESRVMRGVFAQILKVAATDATVLLLGESGTGKELAARGVHDKSPRAGEPFVAVNCAAIPPGLLESELFGHEKGAFTGAVARQIGRFEQAGGGTLFLDEIGDMPLETQSKILRALETRQIERLGGGRGVPMRARIVAATHRDLAVLIRQGAFREDLFHRLNVFPLSLPPLRERREDIPILAERFLDALRPGAALSVEALQRLLAYDWPGNVRELRNTMERAAVLCGGAVVSPAHLPGLVAEGPDAACEAGAGTDLDGRLAAYEKSLIEAALARTGGVQARAAGLLGIKERSLWHRVKKLGIQPGVFKDYGGKTG
ncbi:sigma54 specific transcriptional regulator, Fis family [Solidesulfovibrio fructosivorans JJ]]|uniref:Sigma54 specific transcriptional regulator, Fis family n=1 Tax=Solidesulfovibrio fructosivorans JJ] TaxID=596151 RepID=E1K0F9_SOLFR|nr:sigma-54 dependent transcriptional regulator [Solidesulfovibrio fructosivorans]EFL49902.1 sigma54 specific transcriptional regulator, Fis family [Solidesulfovibrio fructosivorans JJ]]